MPDFNKGDFTQQVVNGHVNANVRLNEKRLVNIDMTSNEEAEGCTITGTVKDLLNDKVYNIGSGGGGGGGDLTTATLKVVVPEGVSSDYIMGCFVMPAVPEQTPDTSFYQSTPYTTGDNVYQVILYKGGAVLVISQGVRSVSGDIASIGGDSYFMTGDCTVTLTSGGGN